MHALCACTTQRRPTKREPMPHTSPPLPSHCTHPSTASTRDAPTPTSPTHPHPARPSSPYPAGHTNHPSPPPSLPSNRPPQQPEKQQRRRSTAVPPWQVRSPQPHHATSHSCPTSFSTSPAPPAILPFQPAPVSGGNQSSCSPSENSLSAPRHPLSPCHPRHPTVSTHRGTLATLPSPLFGLPALSPRPTCCMPCLLHPAEQPATIVTKGSPVEPLPASLACREGWPFFDCAPFLTL